MSTPTLRYVDELGVRGRKVLIRADFNVPLDEYGNITDDTRIRSVLPTINYCLDEGGTVLLLSHMGRPKGKRDEKFSLAPIVRRLSRHLNKEVQFVPDCVGPEAEKAAAAAKPGEVLLFENLRFHPEEEKNDEAFSRALARLAPIYVNDAFAVSHRAHASVVGVTRFVEKCGAGFLLKKEMTYFTRAIENPQRPLLAMIGGAKVSDKLGALKNLLDKVDKVVIGGGMAFTFLRAQGYEVGNSLVEEDLLGMARDILDLAQKKKIRLYLPVDCVAAEKIDARAPTKIVPVQEIPPGWMGLDIGPATVQLFAQVVRSAKTIIWNGPMGVFELDAFARGTLAMASHVANSYALTIVGGGDTDVAVQRAGESANISYISTGGGAFLELLEGKNLPGIEALQVAAPAGPAA